jgi:ribonuclease HI
MRKKRGCGAAQRGEAHRHERGTAGVHRIYFDGACGPVNPGGVATFGWRFIAPNGRTLASDHGEVCRGPGATNNVAEWHALLRALRFLADRGWRGRLQIYGDSRLVINQLTGRWKCHKGHLRRYRDACLNLLRRMGWRASWIPREQNAKADMLSRRPAPKEHLAPQVCCGHPGASSGRDHCHTVGPRYPHQAGEASRSAPRPLSPEHCPGAWRLRGRIPRGADETTGARPALNTKERSDKKEGNDNREHAGGSQGPDPARLHRFRLARAQPPQPEAVRLGEEFVELSTAIEGIAAVRLGEKVSSRPTG